jgi:hypothetical protein
VVRMHWDIAGGQVRVKGTTATASACMISRRPGQAGVTSEARARLL